MEDGTSMAFSCIERLNKEPGAFLIFMMFAAGPGGGMETLMTKKERIAYILEALDQTYGDLTEATLDYRNAWELLVATVLSAQCTDARVNQVTPDLFRKYPDVYAFSEAKQLDMEKAIHSCGFYHNKAKNLIACAKKLVSDFGGEVPSSLEDLTSLPGVGRKTANVVRGHIFHQPSIVVDTHVGRISRRLGLTKKMDPTQVEYDLMRVLPREYWISWNLWLITFGRETCTARNPKCKTCPLREYCNSKDRTDR